MVIKEINIGHWNINSLAFWISFLLVGAIIKIIIGLSKQQTKKEILREIWLSISYGIIFFLTFHIIKFIMLWYAK